MRDIKEADVLRSVLAYLRLAKIFSWRVNSGGIRASHNGKRRFVRFSSINGISDVLAILPGGRLLAIECKRPGERPTDTQKAFLTEVSMAGGLALVVSDVGQLRDALRAEGYGDVP